MQWIMAVAEWTDTAVAVVCYTQKYLYGHIDIMHYTIWCTITSYLYV